MSEFKKEFTDAIKNIAAMAKESGDKEQLIAKKIADLAKISPNPFDVLQHKYFKGEIKRVLKLAGKNKHPSIIAALSKPAVGTDLTASQKKEINQLLISAMQESLPDQYNPSGKLIHIAGFPPINFPTDKSNVIATVKAHWQSLEILEAALEILTPEELATEPFEVGLNILHGAAIFAKDDVVDFMAKKLSKDSFRKLLLAKEIQSGRIPLFYCSENGNAKMVKLFLEHLLPEEVSLQDVEFGFTPLHLVAQEGHAEAAELILNQLSPEQMVKRNIKPFGSTPLHVAIEYGHTQVAENIIARLSAEQCNLPDKRGLTPLHYALLGVRPKEILFKVTKNNKKIIELLLTKLTPEQITADLPGYSALHLAASFASPQLMQEMLAGITGAQLNTPDARGLTPLYFAVQDGRTEIVQLLLAVAGINVHPVIPGSISTPINLAAQLGFTQIVALLIDAGAEVDKGFNGHTPLHSVMQANDPSLEVIDLLLEKGARLEAVTELGFTPLQLAAEQGHVAAVVALLERMTPEQVNIKNNYGSTALHLALLSQNSELIRAFIDSDKVDLTATFKGANALHYAAVSGDLATVQRLLATNKIDVSARNGEGNTALDCLLQKRKKTKACHAIIKILQAQQAKFTAIADPSLAVPAEGVTASCQPSQSDTMSSHAMMRQALKTDGAKEKKESKAAFSFMAAWDALREQCKINHKKAALTKNSFEVPQDLRASNLSRSNRFSFTGQLPDAKAAPSSAKAALPLKTLRENNYYPFYGHKIKTSKPVLIYVTKEAIEQARKAEVWDSLQGLFNDSLHLLAQGDSRQGIKPLAATEGAYELASRGKGGMGDVRLVASQAMQTSREVPGLDGQEAIVLTFDKFAANHEAVRRMTSSLGAW